MCPKGIRKTVAIVEALVLFSVASFVAYQSYMYVARIHALGAVSDIAHIPTWIPHGAITIGFAAIAAMVILRAIQKIAGSDQPAPCPDKSGVAP